MSDSETDIQIVPNHEDERRDRLRAETLGVVPHEEQAAEPDPVQTEPKSEDPKAEESKAEESKAEPKAKTAPVPVQKAADPAK